MGGNGPARRPTDADPAHRTAAPTRRTRSSTSSASSTRRSRAAKREHKVIAVLPAYNAERTLAATIADFPPGCVDEILLVDDGSKDHTVADRPRDGADASSFTRRTAATAATRRPATATPSTRGADIVVMIHPDYQYDARVIPHAVGIIELGICDVVLGSRDPLPAGGAASAACRGGSTSQPRA